MSSEDELWSYLPAPALFQVFQHLNYKELVYVGRVCKYWFQISRDEFLWKRLLYANFKIEQNVPVKTGNSWYNEFKRLCYNIPIIQTETLLEHENEVLHVSFSHNGKYFATCSKDGSVLLWESSYPVTMKYQRDMKAFSWKYTQYSQFNESDTLLLVSGVHFGTPHSTLGEIAVFSLEDGFDLQCRVVSKPYDIFGTWYSDQHLLSGDLRWLARLVSTSVLWLNKASQETGSEHVPITKNMYRFYNRNASSIRAVMIANCLPNSENMGGTNMTKMECDGKVLDRCNPFSHCDINNLNDTNNQAHSSRGVQKTFDNLDYETPIRYNVDYRLAESQADCDSEIEVEGVDYSQHYNNYCEMENPDDFEGIVTNDKYLIFTTGFKTYIPHQIGFKRIKPFLFPKRIDATSLSLEERMEIRKERRELQNSEVPPLEPDWLDYDAVADKFDKTDHLIDLHGHIIGMGLSPDHRYLYVNSRPWPQGYTISHPLDPPPIAQEIDIHVIDLVTLKEVGMMLRSHKAFTPNNECFFIFLDVCDKYVASGAEDKHGYLWDRHYGMCLAKYPHSDIVNSVAFNPKDPEMLVTTSDDYTIKIWRSRAKVNELGLAKSEFPQGIEVRRMPHPRKVTRSAI